MSTKTEWHPRWFRMLRTSWLRVVVIPLWLGLTPHAHSQEAPERWRMVASPIPQARDLFLTLHQQLQQALRKPVELHFDDERPPQPLYTHDQRPLIVLLSETTSILSGDDSDPLHQLDKFTPLMVFFELPWCLFVQQGSPLLQRQNVKNWIVQQPRSVRIGIGARSGQSMFWLHALSQATRSTTSGTAKIIPLSYRGAHNQAVAWRGDADMALAPCWHYPYLGPEVRLLATAQKLRAAYLPPAPLFTDLGLPPLPPSWVAAFAPKDIPPEAQAQLIQALEQTANAPVVVQALTAANLTPLRWSHTQSRQYLDNYQNTWQSVLHLMQWNPAATTRTVPSTER